MADSTNKFYVDSDVSIKKWGSRRQRQRHPPIRLVDGKLTDLESYWISVR